MNFKKLFQSTCNILAVNNTFFVILIRVNPIVRNITNCHVVSEKKIIWLIQMPMFRKKIYEEKYINNVENNPNPDCFYY